MKIRQKPNSGYYLRDVPSTDPELTQTGPNTPMGELMRRFWQPVCLASELTDVPLAIRARADRRQHPFFEYDHVGNVELEEPYARRPRQTERARVQTGPEQDELAASSAGGADREVVEEARPHDGRERNGDDVCPCFFRLIVGIEGSRVGGPARRADEFGGDRIREQTVGSRGFDHAQIRHADGSPPDAFRQVGSRFDAHAALTGEGATIPILSGRRVRPIQR